MKRRILFVISTLLVLGLAIAAFAFGGKTETHKSAMDCCAKSDSCPMKNKETSSNDKASCCDKDDCCCKGGSCPMMKKEHQGANQESCPMMKEKAAKSAEMQNVAVASDTNTCCCQGKHS